MKWLRKAFQQSQSSSTIVFLFGKRLIEISQQILFFGQRKHKQQFYQPTTSSEISIQRKPLIPPVLPRLRSNFERLLYIRASPFGDRPHYGPSIGSLGWFLLVTTTWGYLLTRLDDREATDCTSWGLLDHQHNDYSSHENKGRKGDE